MYLTRTLERTIQRVSTVFPILLVTGPRQVGKTMLLQHCDEDRRYVTLDDIDQREIARTDPALFLQMHPPPLTIDEVQYAPELFSQLKLAADRARQPGMYWLTGSQKFHLMREVSETLAGRVAIIDMLGFSAAEIDGRATSCPPFVPTREWLSGAAARMKSRAAPSLSDLYRSIWLGSFPGSVLAGVETRDVFYRSYVQTYLQRDVRDLARVGDEVAFHRMLRTVAARTAQLVNYADLARDVDVDPKTARAWLSVLETSGLVHLLPPYFSNVTKRLVKAPKLYFLDTGLCAYLTAWSSPETLAAGAMSGAILETWMFTEILKSHWHNGQDASFHFYRDRDQREIDLLIERDGVAHPVEFKRSASPTRTDTRHFGAFASLRRRAALGEVGAGAIVCLRESTVTLADGVTAVPAGWL